MTDLRIIQEARERRSLREARRRRERRIRRARRLRRSALVLAVAAVGLLAVLATSASAPVPPRRSANAAAPAHHPAPPPRADPYGRAPDAIKVDPRLKLGVAAGLLFDVRSGRVLWERNPNQSLPIASLTKMMTALVVVRDSSLTDRVMITRQAVRFTGSGVGLLPRGKRVPEQALLYGLLLPSGNDAAIALAQHVAGSQQRFISLMNAQAARMHLTCTHFATVSGVVDQDNHSCARDLAVIAHAVLTDRTLAPIVASRSAIVPFPIKGGRLFLYNNNPLLRIGYPGADGVKTGYTTAAGLCIVGAARQGHSWLAVVLLHSGNWQDQAITLLGAGFAALARGAQPTPGDRLTASAPARSS